MLIGGIWLFLQMRADTVLHLLVIHVQFLFWQYLSTFLIRREIVVLVLRNISISAIQKCCKSMIRLPPADELFVVALTPSERAKLFPLCWNAPRCPMVLGAVRADQGGNGGPGCEGN